MKFSQNVARLVPSPTIGLAQRAREMRAEGIDVVDLSAGEPQYPAPEHAAQAAIKAIQDGRTGYPPTHGIPELREGVAKYLEETTASSPVDPDCVVVSSGVKQALFNCCFATFEQGDEVLVPAPYWPSYPTIVDLAGATPVIVATQDGVFVPSADELEMARTPRTRGLILNSPGNPTGAVIPLPQLTDILVWAERHGIWVLSDEIYRRLAFEGAAPSVYDVGERGDRVVLLDGLSKAFCMPGFRIGFAVGPPDLLRKSTDLQGQTTSGAATPAQCAAAAALGETEARERFVRELVETLNELRRIGIEGLSLIPALEAPDPPGALYFFARLRDSSRSSLSIAEAIISQAAVACVPGEPFGCPGYIRFNFAVQKPVLREGLRRLEAFFTPD